MSSLFILFDAFTHSDSIGKFIFIILFSLSIVTWTILVQKLLLFSKVRRTCAFIWEKLQQPSSNLLQIEAFPNQIPYGHLIHILKQKTTEVLEKRRFFSKEDKVFLSNQDITLIENHLEITTDIELKKLGKNLYVLHTIVSLAPFVGILGTVWGILLSLFEMKSKQGALSNEVIIGGLSTALGTTVIGLLIAIPALIAYNFLKNAHRGFYLDMQDFSHFLLSQLRMQYQKVES